MEPHRHIVHNRTIHIDFYVKYYVSMILCSENVLLIDETG